MNNEYQKLMKYCKNKKFRISHNGGDISTIRYILQHIRPSEEPDFYCTQDNTVYIIEHFEFDATKNTRKGMNGFARESKIERDFSNQPYRNSGIKTYFEKIGIVISKEWYLENITCVFDKHYGKIPQYKQNLIKQKKASENSDFVVGVFIENDFPPYCNNKYMLHLLNLKQFLDIFENHKDVNFILFGGYFKGVRQLYYINRDTIPLYREFEIDISNVCFSHLNDNDVEWRGELKVEDINV